MATAELELAQVLTDRLLAAVEEPVLAALLLGKAAQAAERGVDLRVADRTDVSSTPLDARDLVTLVGNLVDNAVDAAVAGTTPRWVEVSIQSSEGGDFHLRVADSGAGLPDGDLEDAFTRGWSTKPAASAAGPVGRGIGLSLVGQVVRRHGGTVEVLQETGTVFEVLLPAREVSP